MAGSSLSDITQYDKSAIQAHHEVSEGVGVMVGISLETIKKCFMSNC